MKNSQILTKKLVNLLKNKESIYKEYEVLQKLDKEIESLEKSKEQLFSQKDDLLFEGRNKYHSKSKSLGRVSNKSAIGIKKIKALKKEEQNIINEINFLDNTPNFNDILNEKDQEINKIDQEIAEINNKIDELARNKQQAKNRYKDTLELGNKFLDIILENSSDDSYTSFNQDSRRSCSISEANENKEINESQLSNLESFSSLKRNENSLVPKLQIDKIKNFNKTICIEDLANKSSLLTYTKNRRPQNTSISQSSQDDPIVTCAKEAIRMKNKQSQLSRVANSSGLRKTITSLINTIKTNQSRAALACDCMTAEQSNDIHKLKRLPNGQYSLTINLDDLK